MASRLDAAHEQYESENGFPSWVSEKSYEAAVLRHAAELKRQYLHNEDSAEMIQIVNNLHDIDAFERLLSRCFVDPDNMLDHLNEVLREAAKDADKMAMKNAIDADLETLMEAQ